MRGLTPDEIYEIITFFERNLGHLILALFFGKLAELFLGKDPKGRRRWYIAASYYITMEALEQIPAALDSFIAYLIGALAVFLVLLLEGRENLRIKIFVCVTLFSFRFHTSAISQIHLALFDLETSFFHQITNYRYVDVQQIALLHILAYQIVDLLLYYVWCSILVSIAARNVPFQNRKPTRKEALFLLMPGIMGSLCFFMVHWIILEAKPGETTFWFGPGQNFSIWFASLMINLISLFSVIVVWKLFQELEQSQEERTQQEVLQNQLGKMRSHIREIEQLYTGIRGMKHDIKNHIAVMEELTEQKNYREAQNFLDSIQQTMNRLEYIYRTGNPVTDVVINEKYNQAKKAHILFQTEFFFPEHTCLDVFDISIILDNALENALEAAKLEADEKPFITVSSRLKKQVFLIEVENTFTKALEWESRSGLPLSSKEDRLQHGLGLKNIRRVAEKYYGDLDIEMKNGTFLLTVMLNVNNL